eukprot:2012762-Amphidinium_carterae.1
MGGIAAVIVGRQDLGEPASRGPQFGCMSPSAAYVPSTTCAQASQHRETHGPRLMLSIVSVPFSAAYARELLWEAKSAPNFLG